MSKEVFQAIKDLKSFNYENIYHKANTKEQIAFYREGMNQLYKKLLNDIKTENKTSDIFTIYLDHADKTYQTTTSPERIVIDFIAGMTDEYFINSIHHLKEFSYSKQEQ